MKPPSSFIFFDEYEWNMKMENDIPLIFFSGNMSGSSHEIPIHSEVVTLVISFWGGIFKASQQFF